MAKKKPSEIIDSGTPKQRIKLLIEDIAVKKISRDPLLSESESDILFDSFTTEKELDLFDRWQRLDRVVTNSLTNLQGLKFNVLMNFSNLRGYILVWHTMEESELLVNSILHQINEPERKKIVQDVLPRNSIMFTEVEVDPEGYLELEVDFQNQRSQK